MKVKTFLSTTVLALGLTCLSASVRADYVSERLYMERELNRICTDSIGASYGSASYLECRNYYDRKFYDYGLDWDTLTAIQVRAFLDRTNPYIRDCRNRGLVSTLLWGCIRGFEDRYYDDWHRHNPHFRPKHDYRPHFGGPAPAPRGGHAGNLAPHANPAPRGGHGGNPAPHANPAPRGGHGGNPAPKMDKPNNNRPDMGKGPAGGLDNRGGRPDDHKGQH